MKKLVLVVLAIAVVAPARAAQPAPSLLQTLVKQAPGLRADVLKMAMEAANKAADEGLVARRDLLTVIDYSLPSTQPRLFVFDLAAKKLLFRELCAHGKNSGGNMASYFSNDPGSEATSLGLFVTADTYTGHNGYSLRLKGLEEGFNDTAWDRMIVLHGAYYVSQEAIRVLGRLGKSWGCPAVPVEAAQKIIDTIRGGSAVFAYYPEKRWLVSSAFLH
jgi:hypothetical protein